MSVTSISSVREAIIAALKTIKTANAYAVDLPDANILDTYDPRFADKKEPTDYPKAMLVLDEATNADLPSRRKEKSIVWILVLVVKPTLMPDGETYADAPEALVEQLVDSVDLMCSRSPTLSNLVDIFRFEGFTSDSGYTHPEGTAVVRLLVEYQQQF